MEEIVPGTVEHNELFVYRDIMDEEIVDRYGKHLFRVNDVVLRIQKGKLRIIVSRRISTACCCAWGRNARSSNWLIYSARRS